MLSFFQYRPPKCYQVNGLRYLVLLVLHILLVITCLANTSDASCDETDRESLFSFLFAISSQPGLNWSTSTDCCIWEGVGCDENHRVSYLWLPSRGLGGSISPSISNLSYLLELNLSHNSLSGTLPGKLFTSLNRLQIIDLSYNRLQAGQLSDTDKLPRSILSVNISSNQFSGTIQYSFLHAAMNLLMFNASNNSFTGTIPSFICSISPFITSLDFSLNSYVGHIPKGFGECSSLETLRVGYNNLSGPISRDIYGVFTLKEVSLAANSLSGPIDESIGNLTDLKVLALYRNELISRIPHSIGKLHKLEQLLLDSNQLNGIIPFSLSNCIKLTTLILRDNNLEGELSGFDFSSLVQLRIVDLGYNHFTGSLPASLFSCKLLSAIRLSNNQLQGEILPDIQSLQSLSFLSLVNNSLTNIRGAIKNLGSCRSLRTLILSINFYGESLPGEESFVQYDEFQNLQVLGLSGCRFTGQIPKWLIKLRKLEALDLSQNQLSGSIPSWMANFSGLFLLGLSINLLSGNFPPELHKLPRLSSQQSTNQVNIHHLELPVFGNANKIFTQYNQISNMPPSLHLGNNNLSGNIPSEIGQLKFIHVLDLSNNDFSGNIPDTISNITNLEKLDLSGNHFCGKIPASLTNLHFLSFLSVANNNLEGPIPTGGQFDTFSNTSFQENPGLCGVILQRPCSEQPVLLSPNQPATTIRKIAKGKIVLYLICGIGFGIGFGISFFLSIYTFSYLSTKCVTSIISSLGHRDYGSHNQFRR